jgi:hypothetical protein
MEKKALGNIKKDGEVKFYCHSNDISHWVKANVINDFRCLYIQVPSHNLATAILMLCCHLTV